MLSIINFFRDEQEDSDDEIEKIDPSTSVIAIPSCAWRRTLSNAYTRPLQEFSVSFWEGMKLAGLGYRMWRYISEEKKAGREAYMDVFSAIKPAPNQGVPLGGMGAGSITRGWTGDFHTYQLKPGRPHYDPIPANQFSVWVNRQGDKPKAMVLNPRDAPVDCLQSWNWNFVGDSSYYCALFPRAWTVYDEPDKKLRMTCRQISPVIANNYQESSYPVCVFVWTLENLSKSKAVDVSLMFTHQNGTGNPSDSLGGHKNSSFESEDGKYVGVELKHFLRPDPLEKDTDPRTSADYVTYGIATMKNENYDVSCKSYFRTDGNGASLWGEFAKDGKLRPVDVAKESAAGEKIGSALASKVSIPPGQHATIVFSLSWDSPMVTFGHGRTYSRRYTKFYGADGNKAQQIACDALNHFPEWEEQIEAWQYPILADKDLPTWYKATLFNELYYLVSGGTVWVNDNIPLCDGDEDEGTDQKKEKEKETENEGEGEQHHGDKEKRKEWKKREKEIGKFAYLEGHEYLMYNTYDVHFYASFSLGMCWPLIEMAIQRDFAKATLLEEKENHMLMASGVPAPRKVRGAVPHDLGSPVEDPWHKVNIYNIQDTSRWKDLNSKFVLQSYRDFLLSSKDVAYLDNLWPAIKEAITYLEQFDKDNDGMIENEGFPDQTYDTWSASGASAYSGGLWVAALGAAGEMAKATGEEELAQKYLQRQKRAAEVYNTLWNKEGYFNYDSSNSAQSKSIMADQLAGHWYTKACELQPFITDKRAERALKKVYEYNVKKFSALAEGMFKNKLIGAVNGMTPKGKIDKTTLQSSEVWTGTTFALAANMLQEGLTEEAWNTAKGVYEGAYKRFGFWFQTPEAWDAGGRYRSMCYMRPLSIWAMQWAWQNRSKNNSTSEEDKGKEKEK